MKNTTKIAYFCQYPHGAHDGPIQSPCGSHQIHGLTIAHLDFFTESARMHLYIVTLKEAQSWIVAPNKPIRFTFLLRIAVSRGLVSGRRRVQLSRSAPANRQNWPIMPSWTNWTSSARIGTGFRPSAKRKTSRGLGQYTGESIPWGEWRKSPSLPY